MSWYFKKLFKCFLLLTIFLKTCNYIKIFVKLYCWALKHKNLICMTMMTGQKKNRAKFLYFTIIKSVNSEAN